MKSSSDHSERNSGPYRPSPQDIRQACERIQAGWTPHERDKRAGRSAKVGWVPPSINMSCMDDVSDDDPIESHRQAASAAPHWIN